VRVLRRELRDWRVPALALLAVGVTLISLAKVPFPFTYIALPLLLAAAVLEMGALLVVTLLVSVTIALSMALGVFVWPPVVASWHDMFVYLAYGAALVPAQLLAAAMANMRDSHQHLAVATEELRRANEGLEQFVRIASHDLREPLNTVVQFSGLIAHDHGAALPPNAQDWLTLVIRAGSRMRHMLDDVLHYVRMQRGFPDPGEAVPLDALLQDVQQTLAGRVLETGASIQVAPLPVVQGHETLLSLLFQNLLSNALKFMPEGRVPVIEVSAAQGVRSEAGMAVITVADNGIGIAAKDLPKLFQPFSRLHLRKHYDGTGLGLALCRQIAEAHGGTVVIKSELGRGTRVVVRLPLAQG
jgi:signal transduction histidine kinase